jgi:hypothetical protein
MTREDKHIFWLQFGQPYHTVMISNVDTVGLDKSMTLMRSSNPLAARLLKATAALGNFAFTSNTQII